MNLKTLPTAHCPLPTAHYFHDNRQPISDIDPPSRNLDGILPSIERKL